MAVVKFSKQTIEPNPLEVDYWVDITSDPYGSVWKYYNGIDWVSLNLNDGSNDGLSSFDYYTKEQINSLLSGKADVDSVESKVDDAEFANVIQNIEFREIGDNQMEMVLLKYDNATVGVTIPMASETNPGMLSGESFRDFVKQSQLQSLYDELYQIMSDLSLAEKERNDAEQLRNTNENERIAAETNRFNAESTRQFEEANRVTNENNRVTAENNRNTAEQLRIQAEGNRASTFNTLKGEMQNIIQEGEAAVVNTEAATSAANQIVQTYEGKVAEQDAKLTNLASEVDSKTNEISSFKETITNQVNNYRPIEIIGDVTNAADEEDITSENGLLKFKNRNSLNGMGYVILRRNKSFAEQVNQANTIYEIRYDFELNENTVHIPNNCVLIFVGGSLNNGKISGNNTVIESNTRCFTNVVCLGSFSCEGQAKWFVDKSYIKTEGENHILVKNNSTSDIQKLLDSSFANIVFDSGLYYIENTIYIRKSVSIFMQGKGMEKMTKIKANPTNQTSIFTDKDIDMLVIDCYGEATDKKISIIGGSFDFTLCEKNSHNCITVDLTKENTRIWGLNLDVDINGCFAKNSTTGFFESTGIKFLCPESDASNGSYASMIRISGNLSTLFCGIDITRTKATWITDVVINSMFGWCVRPVISNVSAFRFNGSIQTANMFNEENNRLYPCIDLTGGEDIVIDGKVWDTGTSDKVHQEAVRIGSSKRVFMGDFYHSLMINTNSVGQITGNLNAIVNSDTVSRIYFVNKNAYEVKGNPIINSFEALDLRGCSISAKYVNELGVEEDVLDVENLSNVFYVNKKESIIRFKSNPTDNGLGYIELLISNDSNLTIYAQYIGFILLASTLYPACDEIEIIKEYSSKTLIYSEKQGLLSDVLQSYVFESRSILLTGFKSIKIRLKKIITVNGEFKPILLNKIICTDSFSLGKGMMTTYLPIGGGTIYGDLNISGALKPKKIDFGYGSEFKAENAKLISYSGFNLLPIHAFNANNVASWAVRGQMAYQNINGRPVWRNEKAHDNSNPLAGWSDALGNPANAKLNGQTSERPSGVNKGFTYFDTTLNKPIWWTGSNWVDATGTVV